MLEGLSGGQVLPKLVQGGSLPRMSSGSLLCPPQLDPDTRWPRCTREGIATGLCGHRAVWLSLSWEMTGWKVNLVKGCGAVWLWASLPLHARTLPTAWAPACPHSALRTTNPPPKSFHGELDCLLLIWPSGSCACTGHGCQTSESCLLSVLQILQVTSLVPGQVTDSTSEFD